MGMGMGDGDGMGGWVGGWVWQYSNACLDFLQFSHYWSMVLCLHIQVAGLDTAGLSSFSVSNSYTWFCACPFKWQGWILQDCPVFLFPIPRPPPANQPQIQSKFSAKFLCGIFATESSSPSLMPFNKSEWWWVGGVGVGMGMGMGDGDGMGGWVGGALL